MFEASVQFPSPSILLILVLDRFKMSQGTLYINKSPRNFASKALISHFKLDVKIVDLEQASEFASLFPLKQAPAFLGPKGFKLTEAIAIQYYCMLFSFF